MDKFDVKILETLQKNAALSISDIARIVGLSQTPCWNRIQKLEKKGVIAKRVALLNPKFTNSNTTVIVSIKAKHEVNWLEKFQKIIQKLSQIHHAYRINGHYDYMLIVKVKSIEDYDTFYKTLVSSILLQEVNSSMVMETLKYTTVLDVSDLAS